MEEEHGERKFWNCFNFGSEICDPWIREKYNQKSLGRNKQVLSENDSEEADAICLACRNFIPIE